MTFPERIIQFVDVTNFRLYAMPVSAFVTMTERYFAQLEAGSVDYPHDLVIDARWRMSRIKDGIAKRYHTDRLIELNNRIIKVTGQNPPFETCYQTDGMIGVHTGEDTGVLYVPTQEDV
jgi:hypothetical protein